MQKISSGIYGSKRDPFRKGISEDGKWKSGSELLTKEMELKYFTFLTEITEFPEEIYYLCGLSVSPGCFGKNYGNYDTQRKMLSSGNLP